MKRIINEANWKGEKYVMEWFSDINYEALKNITQVYATLFDQEGKICLLALKGEVIWSLPGGDLEEQEAKDWEKALIKKTDNEADLRINEKTITRLGYIKVTPKNKDNPLGVHYLLRVAGQVSKIKEQKKDGAGDPVNERVFISMDEFPNYCPWGKMGVVLIEKAKEALKGLE